MNHSMQPFVAVEQIMGLPFSLHIRPARRATSNFGLISEKNWQAGLEQRLVDASESVWGTLREFDAIFSRWKQDSDINRLARGEDMSQLDSRVTTCFELAQQANEVTRGYFEAFVTEGSDLIFDPTGLVKGLAMEVASEHLKPLEADGLTWCLNGGGDVLVGGANEHWPWTVGIESAEDPNSLVGTVTLYEGAVATSGTYARGNHLYRPTPVDSHTYDFGDLSDAAQQVRAQEVSEHEGAISVFGPSITWADIWATALFVGEQDLAQTMLEWDMGYGVVCDQRENVAARGGAVLGGAERGSATNKAETADVVTVVA